MKLQKFEIANYKSITKVRSVILDSRVTTIVGENNAGKSNLVQGIATAIDILRIASNPEIGNDPTLLGFHVTFGNIYRRERDFPKSLAKNSKRVTKFKLTFRLNEEERRHFKEQLKSTINEELPVEIKIKPPNQGDLAPRVEVSYKKQRAPEKIKRKVTQISKLITDKFEFANSVAVRPGGAGIKEVEKLIQSNLNRLSRQDAEYDKALRVIEGFRKEQLDIMESSFQATLVKFLPDLKEVEFDVNSVIEAQTRDLDVLIDDGVSTTLAEKGDGVQSLFTLAVLQYKANQRRKNDQDLLTVIEEPEAHLNSRAMWRLREVVEDMAEGQQVVIVTHSAVFVDRVNIENNILVSDDRMAQAQNISQIRDELGVHVSEGMEATQFILLVEGDTDAEIIEKVVDIFDLTDLRVAISTGKLKISSMNGVSHLQYHLLNCYNQMITPFVILDSDDSARGQVAKARANDTIDVQRLFYCVNPRSKEGKNYPATIEDIASLDLIAAAVNEVWGLSVTPDKFAECRPGMILDIVESIVEGKGRHVDDSMIVKLKLTISEFISKEDDFNAASVNPFVEFLNGISLSL